MSNQKDTIDYTIRCNSMLVDKVISQLSTAAGIPKSTFIRNKLEEIFQNKYDQYAASSSLVAALMKFSQEILVLPSNKLQ